MNKKMVFTFLAGIVAGSVLSNKGRYLAKEGIKAGIRGGRKLKELSQQAMEDLEDVAAEANEELADQGHGTGVTQ